MGSLDAYVTDFEDQLLGSTKDYYARKSQEWVETDDTPTYLAKAELAKIAARATRSLLLASREPRPKKRRQNDTFL